MMKITASHSEYYGRVKSHVSLTGIVNSNNCVHEAHGNSHHITLTPLQETKVTVWCGIANIFVFCLYFFEEITSTGMKSFPLQVLGMQQYRRISAT